MRSRLAFVVAVVPMLVLLAGLPFANRIAPVILGLPFLLFWIVGWVAVTPLFLGAAYLLVYAGDGGRPAGDAR